MLKCALPFRAINFYGLNRHLDESPLNVKLEFYLQLAPPIHKKHHLMFLQAFYFGDFIDIGSENLPPVSLLAHINAIIWFLAELILILQNQIFLSEIHIQIK